MLPDAQNPNPPFMLQIELQTAHGILAGDIPEDKVAVWPEGFPFVCNVDHPANGPGLLALQKGDQGQVLRLHWGNDDNGNSLQGQPNVVPWFHVSCKGIQGYVNFWALQIGRVNAIGIVTIVPDLPASVPAPFSDSDLPSGAKEGVFFKTLTGLILALKDAPESIVVPYWVTNRLSNSEDVSKLAITIFQGVKRAGFGSWLDGTYTLEHLVRNATTVQNSKYTRGIYGIGYADFERSFEGDDPKLYIGKSIRMQTRMTDHASMCTKVWSYHYQARNRANKKREVVLCALEDDDNDLLSLAEQIFTTMFNSYHHTLVDFNAELAVDPDEANMMRNYAHKEQASLISMMARSVFKKTGWTNYVGSETFKASDGLNRTVPMNEELAGQREKAIFTKSTLPGHVSVYRRAPYNAFLSTSTNQKQIVLYNWAASTLSGPGGKFNIAITPEVARNKFLAQIQPGTMIYPSFEISEAGPHPMGWARLPELGPISNWNDARRLAFCVEFQLPDQKWTKVYIQAGKVFDFAPGSGSGGIDASDRKTPSDLVQGEDKLTGALLNYVQAVAIIRALEQQRVPNDYSWMINFGIARVKEVTYSFLDQEVKIKPKAATNAPVQKATARSMLSMITQLISAGAHLPNTFAGQVAAGSRGAPRKRCDSCFTSVGIAAHAASVWKCVRHSNNGCTNCFQRGIPCSWTKMSEAPALWQVLGPAPPNKDNVIQDGAPELMNIYYGRG
ncbi:hypothetical protein AYO22_11661 [Fonsecaea multimorphosa]|nr:hypothetical protein AYO22_11661 [Fonsecaea multimorphosa]